MDARITKKGMALYLLMEKVASERGLDVTNDEDLLKILDVLPEPERQSCHKTAAERGWAPEVMEVAYLRVIRDSALKLLSSSKNLS